MFFIAIMKPAILEQLQVQDDLETKRKHALAVLESLRGSVKIKRRLNKKERDELALNFTPEDEERIINKYNMKF